MSGSLGKASKKSRVARFRDCCLGLLLAFGAIWCAFQAYTSPSLSPGQCLVAIAVCCVAAFSGIAIFEWNEMDPDKRSMA